MAENESKESFYDKLVKGGIKGAFLGTFFGVIGYVVGAIADAFVPGITPALGAGLFFLGGLGIGLADAF